MLDSAGHAALATSGRAWVDADRYRLELDPAAEPRAYDAEIGDGIGGRFLLDSASKTWFRPEEGGPLLGAGGGDRCVRLSRLGFELVEREEATPTIERMEETTDEVFLGGAVRKFVLKLRADLRGEIGGEPVQARVAATVIAWTSAAAPAAVAVVLPPRACAPSPLLERRVSQELARLPATLFRVRASSTLAFADSDPATSLWSGEVTAPEAIEVPAARFHLPEGYRHRPPLVSAPSAGRATRPRRAPD